MQVALSVPGMSDDDVTGNMTSTAPLQILDPEIVLTAEFVFDGSAIEVVGMAADDIMIVTRPPNLPILLTVRSSVTGAASISP